MLILHRLVGLQDGRYRFRLVCIGPGGWGEIEGFGSFGLAGRAAIVCLWRGTFGAMGCGSLRDTQW